MPLAESVSTCIPSDLPAIHATIHIRSDSTRSLSFPTSGFQNVLFDLGLLDESRRERTRPEKFGTKIIYYKTIVRSVFSRETFREISSK